MQVPARGGPPAHEPHAQREEEVQDRSTQGCIDYSFSPHRPSKNRNKTYTQYTLDIQLAAYDSYVLVNTVKLNKQKSIGNTICFNSAIISVNIIRFEFDQRSQYFGLLGVVLGQLSKNGFSN